MEKKILDLVRSLTNNWDNCSDIYIYENQV